MRAPDVARKAPANVPEKPREEILLAGLGSDLPGADDVEERPDVLFPDFGEGDARIRLDRQHDLNKKWVYHGHLSVEQGTEAYIAEMFGGGQYRCQLTTPNERGGWSIRQQRFFELPGPYKPPTKSIPTPMQVANAAKGEATTQGAAPPIIPHGADPNQVLSSALVTQLLDVMRATREPRPTMDWGPIIVAGLGVLERVVARPKDESRGNEELRRQIDDLKLQLVQMANRPSPSASGITEALAAIQQLIGVRDMIVGESSPRSGGGDDDALVNLGTKVLTLMESQRAPHVAPVPSNAPAEAAPQPGVPVQPWQQLLRAYRAQLLMAVGEGQPADLIADSIFNMMPERFMGLLENFVRLPNAVGLIMQEIPQLAPHGDWVTELRNALLRAFDEPGEESEDAANVEE